jgi:4-hydroxy-3-polyprenylbenzoate decarboxylase
MTSSQSSSTPPTYVLGVTGASGTAYAIRLAQVLLNAGSRLHLVFSDAAQQVMLREIGRTAPAASATAADWTEFLQSAFLNQHCQYWGFSADFRLPPDSDNRLSVHSLKDYSASIASGSYLTQGMVICPCSMGTLSSIANGASTNLIQRAADVHLKERRRLIVVPRETPLGLIALQNMALLHQAGATVLPAMPGFYQFPRCLADLVDFIVARICDQLGVAHQLVPRWGVPEE